MTNWSSVSRAISSGEGSNSTRGAFAVSGGRAKPRWRKKGSANYNYEQFWQQAWAAANASLARRESRSALRQRARGRASRSSVRWPRVYVYSLPPPLSDWDPHGATNDAVFGRRIAFDGRLRDTNHYGFSMVRNMLPFGPTAAAVSGASRSAFFTCNRC